MLSASEEAIIVAFRRHTLLLLDDCLYAPRTTIPTLTRSSLHRFPRRHSTTRLREIEGDKEPKKRFKSYLIGFLHIDIAELSTAQGTLYLFVAIDQASRFVFVQLVESTNRVMSSAFMVAFIAAVSYSDPHDPNRQCDVPPAFADTGLGHLSFGLFRGSVSERGVDPPPIMVTLDIDEQVSSGLLAVCPSPLEDAFDLERMEEALHGCVDAPMLVKHL